MASSYQFKVRAVDLAKLQSIRTMKNNKKCVRLFREMGLPIEMDQSASSKRIIQLKQKRGITSASNTTKGESTTLTILQNIPKEQCVHIKHHRGYGKSLFSTKLDKMC